MPSGADMIYDARQIANWFIIRAARDGRTLSVMSLLKLAYIAHGWHLEVYDRPLFHNRIEAWRYGPVIPDVYRAFRPQGVTPAETLAGLQPVEDETSEEFLEQIYGIYGAMSPFRLSALTHVKDGPWDIVTRHGGPYSQIPDELIKLHYVNKRKAAVRASEHQNS